ncbi:glycosyltransferase family 2 protein [Mucilaginibacter pallidiroseus]|uniref:Glycosyltransferase family 2 protein n=1 Tax=Mucilaginibacter pallidiroseus TaxID=2599295 RepID=A0A563UIT4_9SPHI|nr:glycosyltransferase family 2 protein [Mucilaginibacter pallidiroseus]TWR31178.1 glycosyltransferase family 2 protein [Mucilaginibacter pallidiroseus]
MPSIGLVTVLYNSNEVLEGFFKSLSLQDFKDYHLYIVDNSPSSSTDTLIADLSVKFPLSEFTHIKNDENAGVAKGNNQGIKRAMEDGAEYLLLLNNDIEFSQPYLLSQMLELALKGENIIVPKILYFDSKRIWMAGGELLKRKGYTIHVGEDEIDNGQYNTNAYYKYAPTCFMLISKQVFDKVGYMDERYFVYFDDTDFIYRAVNNGYKVLYVGKLEVLHKVSSTTGGYETPFGVYYTTRNRIFFIRKNLTMLTKVVALSYTLFTRIIKALRYDKQQLVQLKQGIKDGLELK